MRSKMLLDATFSYNDIHLELEDSDHDVIVIHAVIPPLSFKGRDEEAEDDQLERPELDEDDCLEDEFAEPDEVEVVDDVVNVMEIVVEDDLVEEDVGVVGDVVNLDVDNVVDRPDHKDVELYNIDVHEVVLLAVQIVVRIRLCSQRTKMMKML